jgi:hypothetical protein
VELALGLWTCSEPQTAGLSTISGVCILRFLGCEESSQLK